MVRVGSGSGLGQGSGSGRAVSYLRLPHQPMTPLVSALAARAVLLHLQVDGARGAELGARRRLEDPALDWAWQHLPNLRPPGEEEEDAAAALRLCVEHE